MKKLIFISIAVLFLSGCTSSGYDNYYRNDDGENIEMENPYSEGTGHYAGYEWAEKTGGICSGNSDSFIEGCEEYYRQLNN